MTKISMPLTKNLWFLVANILMIILGLYIWNNPLTTVLTLSLYLGIAIICIGITYLSYKDIIPGIINIIIGLILTLNLGSTAAALSLLLGVWCLIIGALQIYAAHMIKKEYKLWVWSFSAGLLSVIFGFLILLHPSVGTIAITAIIGGYFVVYGAIGIAEYIHSKK